MLFTSIIGRGVKAMTAAKTAHTVPSKGRNTAATRDRGPVSSKPKAMSDT